MCKIKNIIFFIGIVLIGIILVIVSGVLCSNFLKVYGLENSIQGKLVLTWFSLAIGFCVVPIYILKKKYVITKGDLGIGQSSKNERMLIALIAVIAVVYLITKRNMSSIAIIGIVLLQNIAVAFAEEFFSKGILYYIMGRITSNKAVIVLICSCVFAFAFHSSDVFLTNLTYRLPMAIILGICYLKTNNLYLPITLHLVNNLLATSMLK